LVLLGLAIVSLGIGARPLDLDTLIQALTRPPWSQPPDHSIDLWPWAILWQVRLPRTLAAVAVGAALAVAGAIVQALTRNPLGDPGLLGINAGAALGVVAGLLFLDHPTLTQSSFLALGGAALGTLAIYTLGSLGPGGFNPLNLTLAGAALTALLSACTTGILVLSQRTLEEIRFWLVGSLGDRPWPLVAHTLPLIALGLVLAFTLGQALTVLTLGETLAQSLGQRIPWIQALSGLGVVLLAGGSVALAGSLSFVGLVVPQGVRRWVGADYGWILPYSALGGAITLLGADVGVRLLGLLPQFPQELPVGLVLPLVGVPVFLALIYTPSPRP